MGGLVSAATVTGPGPDAPAATAGHAALVWIDAREAVVVRWTGEEAAIERLASDVPAHVRATGHVRYDPATRHGGPDRQAAGERRRIEALDRFVDAVAGRVARDDYLVIVGHGTVHERLEARLRELDEASHRSRAINLRRADRPTERQLVAELREHLGAGPRRWLPGGR
ncbi:MAG: hypothetical protein AB1736_03655 [Chloroflexota bacterium]